ncbi:MAG: hypothetical protein R2828_01405 [Saprospiraceae bacterium]
MEKIVKILQSLLVKSTSSIQESKKNERVAEVIHIANRFYVLLLIWAMGALAHAPLSIDPIDYVTRFFVHLVEEEPTVLPPMDVLKMEDLVASFSFWMNKQAALNSSETNNVASNEDVSPNESYNRHIFV